MKMRTVNEAAKYFRDMDPETAITYGVIDRLVKDGEIPMIEVGSRRLVSIEAIEEYLKKAAPTKEGGSTDEADSV